MTAFKSSQTLFFEAKNVGPLLSPKMAKMPCLAILWVKGRYNIFFVKKIRAQEARHFCFDDFLLLKNYMDKFFSARDSWKIKSNKKTPSVGQAKISNMLLLLAY